MHRNYLYKGTKRAHLTNKSILQSAPENLENWSKLFLMEQNATYRVFQKYIGVQVFQN